MIKIVIDNIDNAEELLSKIRTQKPIKMTPDEALNLLIDNSLSKNTYQNLRVEMKSRNANILPIYFEVSQAKKKCRPDEIQSSDVKASTSIKSLSCHTISRIVLLEEDQIVSYMKKVNKSVIDAETIFAYGADGTTGQIEYPQASSSGSVIDDHSLFTVTMTPLQLRSKLDEEILWKNPTPQSFQFVRPLSLEFTKETMEHVKVTFQQIEEDIENLSPYQKNTEEELQVNISSLFFPSLFDGKVLNFLLDNKSSQSCSICKSTPKHFNNLLNFDNDQLKPKGDSSLIYGC